MASQLPSLQKMLKLLIYSHLLTRGESQESDPFPQLSHNPDDVAFYLFTPPSYSQSRLPQEIRYLNDTSLTRSRFVPNVLTVIFIHGYNDTYTDADTTISIMNAYLGTGIPGNFMAVDWSKLATPSPYEVIGFVPAYPQVLPNIPIVGKRVAEFICWLRLRHVVNLSKVHLIGHSLGAHVAGEAGTVLQELLGGERIRRITGLDPAGPLLEPPLKLERVLDRNDADFVDAIHTSVGLFGNIETNGDVDIYVNNGVVQPGCWSPDVAVIIGCSHGFVIAVYAASLRWQEIACKCYWWMGYLGNCNAHKCLDPIMLGPYMPESARGIYQLITSSDPWEDGYF